MTPDKQEPGNVDVSGRFLSMWQPEMCCVIAVRLGGKIKLKKEKKGKFNSENCRINVWGKERKEEGKKKSKSGIVGFLGGKKNLKSYAQFCVEESNVVSVFNRCLNSKWVNEWKSKDTVFFRETRSSSLCNQEN